jgi:carboxymethylenebutenolidase
MNGTEETGKADLVGIGLPRRGFVAALAAGLTLATTRVDAQVIHTDTNGLDVAEVQIPTDDGKLHAYYARPLGDGPFPIVLVIEELFGVHAYIQDICRRLAKQGYMAVATEYCARLGDISRMSDINEIFAKVISKAPDARLMADADATAAWARQNRGDASLPSQGKHQGCGHSSTSLTDLCK